MSVSTGPAEKEMRPPPAEGAVDLGSLLPDDLHRILHRQAPELYASCRSLWAAATRCRRCAPMAAHVTNGIHNNVTRKRVQRVLHG